MREDVWVKRWVGVLDIVDSLNFTYNLRQLLRKGYVGKTIYLVLPVVMYMINIMLIIKAGVFGSVIDSGIKVSYIEDISNSFGLTVLFFLSFFLAGYFPKLINDNIYTIIAMEPRRLKKKNVFLLRLIILVILVIIMRNTFIGMAINSDGKMWVAHIHLLTLFYYVIVVALTWYNATVSLLYVLISGGIIYRLITKEMINYEKVLFFDNAFILKFIDMLTFNISYGIFYVIGAACFVFFDQYNNFHNHIHNTFENPYIALGLMLFVIILLIMALIPYVALLQYCSHKKGDLLSMCDNEIRKNAGNEKELDKWRKKKKSIRKSRVIITNKAVFAIITSVVIPLIGIVTQIIQIFMS